MTEMTTQYPNLPVETYTAARKIYNIHNIYLRIGDQLEEIFSAINFSKISPSANLSIESAARLAMITGFQIAESLPDLHTSEASHLRMDWKYALHLPLYYPGIRPAALCNFRQNLYCSPAGIQEFGNLLQYLGKLGLFARYSNQSLYPYQSLTNICNINRLFLLNQSMQAALSAITSTAPTWIRSNIRPHWYEHYQAKRIWKAMDPASIHTAEEALALGKDMQWLLNSVEQYNSLELSNQIEILELRHLFHEQFLISSEDITWRTAGCESCAIHE